MDEAHFGCPGPLDRLLGRGDLRGPQRWPVARERDSRFFYDAGPIAEMRPLGSISIGFRILRPVLIRVGRRTGGGSFPASGLEISVTVRFSL